MFKQVWIKRVSLNYVNKITRLLRNFIYVMTKSTNRVAWLSLCHNELSSVTAERRFYYFWFIFASSTFLPFNFIQFHSTSKIIWRRNHKNVSLIGDLLLIYRQFYSQAELYVKLTKKSIQNFEKSKFVLEMFLSKQQIKISNMVGFLQSQRKMTSNVKNHKFILRSLYFCPKMKKCPNCPQLNQSS